MPEDIISYKNFDFIGDRINENISSYIPSETPCENAGMNWVVNLNPLP